jgi:hypothetical protein
MLLSVAPLMKMSLTDVKNLVPPGSGIFFIGCPNCNGGAQEMGILNWEPGMGDQVKCKFCSMTFPNEKYPHNGEKVIIAPSGAKQVYRYHQNCRVGRSIIMKHMPGSIAGNGFSKWLSSFLRYGPRKKMLLMATGRQ